MKKYEFTGETKVENGITLNRIRAIRDFGNVKAGDIGGWIEKEENLSHEGEAWVFGEAKVYGEAWVFGEAEVFGEAKVFGSAKVGNKAKVGGEAEVFDKAEVYDKAWVGGEAEVGNKAKVGANSDYIVFKNWWSSGRYFTWTRSNDMWRVGCFYGTGEELIKKAYEDSEISGREYERIVKYVEAIKQK